MSNLKRKVLWTMEEEDKLRNYVLTHGPHHWETISRNLDIGKSENSCRLKWENQLKPGIKRGGFTDDEVLLILRLRFEGNGWAKIAKNLPGRVDNDIKNFCNSARLKNLAHQLNCNVESQEFLNKMTERSQAAHHANSTSGSGVTANTSVSYESFWEFYDDYVQGRINLPDKDWF